MGSNLASKSLPECPGPPILLENMALQQLFLKLAFVLPKCSWTAFWQLLGPSWAPFGLNLGPLGRLFGSTCALWDGFEPHLGASWASLGLHLGHLGASWANLGSLGRQMGSKWTPIGRQMDAEWVPNWTATTAANVSVRLKNAITAAKCC